MYICVKEILQNINFEMLSKFISGMDASTTNEVTGTLICIHYNLQTSLYKCEMLWLKKDSFTKKHFAQIGVTAMTWHCIQKPTEWGTGILNE